MLARAGAYDSARNEYALAEEKFLAAGNHERELAWQAFEHGVLEQEARRLPRAPQRLKTEREQLEAAIVHATRAQLRSVVCAAELNLAWSLADAGELAGAERHLARADELDDPDVRDVRRQLHAELAYHHHELARAAAIAGEIYDHLELDRQIDVCVLQARIALELHDYDRAERWAQRGIDGARALRFAQPEVEPHRWALTRRAPYELMFVARARAGRIDNALATLDQWQGLDAPHGDPHAHDLLALVLADDRLWRIVSADHRLDLAELGPMSGFEQDVRQFSDEPTGPAAARLGGRLVPDALVRPSDDSLRVVRDAALDGLPVAALRVHGAPVIAARPVIYARGVSRLACRAPSVAAGPRPAVILGDASGDLPAAGAEVRSLAQLLHATAATGAAVTRDALWAAGPGSLLHVAVHADLDDSGGFLALADGPVRARHIVAHQRAPELVVLSACVSALSTGRELADSLAAAFLAAGATQVVASLRAVPDADARALMTRFYAAGGADDPARALARVQRALAAAGDPRWPSFAVFGQDLCLDHSE